MCRVRTARRNTGREPAGRVGEGAAFITPGTVAGAGPSVVGRDGEPALVRAGVLAPRLLLAEEVRFVIAADEAGPGPRYRPGR